MSTDHFEPDDTANKVVAIFGDFLRLMTRKHGFAPEHVAKAAVASAVMLFLEQNDDERAAANYLRAFADEIDASVAERDIKRDIN